jgi:hypothetical protein
MIGIGPFDPLMNQCPTGTVAQMVMRSFPVAMISALASQRSEEHDLRIS